MRFLALDYGQKRIGVALSDPLGITAQPQDFLPAGDKIFEHIAKLVQEKDVGEIVIGHPKKLSGEIGAMAKEVEAFTQKLKTFVSVSIYLWDERFSSTQTEAVLIEAQVRREKRKELRDSIAAAIILQSFMQFRQNGGTLSAV